MRINAVVIDSFCLPMGVMRKKRFHVRMGVISPPPSQFGSVALAFLELDVGVCLGNLIAFYK